MVEFCHGVTPFPQPSPARNPQGDCFACAVHAGVRHFLGADGPTFDACWDAFIPEGHKGPSNTWHGLRSALYALDSDLEVTHDLVRPEVPPAHYSFAWWQQFDVGTWNYRLEGWLRSGWLAIVQISFGGTLPVTPDGKLGAIDHFVLLDGVRYGWKREQTQYGEVGTVEHETHVVCSARGAYWIRTHDLLVKHGAAAWTLFRPDHR